MKRGHFLMCMAFAFATNIAVTAHWYGIAAHCSLTMLLFAADAICLAKETQA